MLDNNLKEELKNVFSQLKEDVLIEMSYSDHKDLKSLKSMLEDVASTSENIKLKETLISSIPSFKIKNFQFIGIPNGHEFTTLIIGILNSQGIGKMPDKGTINRIKQYPKIELESYISLSCTNCPEVVQSLNLISFINPLITHKIKDGQYFEDEIKEKNIKGVPSVFSNNELFFAGKTEFSEILDKIEKKFNIEKKEVVLDEYDVAIIGGGPAGVSSAIYTARKGLKTCIIAENIGGQINDTKGIENLISNPYIEGKDLSERLRNHLNEYNIDLLENRKVVSLEETIKLNTNEIIKAKSKIITTGANWRKLNIKGEQKFLGSGVHFCPHCDGPFYKNKDVIVVGGGNSGVEAAIDLANITKSVTIVEFGNKLIADEVLIKKAKEKNNIKIITMAESLEIKGDENIKSLIYKDRNNNENIEIKTNGIFVQIGLSPNTQFLSNVKLNDKKEIIIDEKNRTNIEGVFAAGDVTNTPYKQIIISMGEGAKAALSAFEYLSFK